MSEHEKGARPRTRPATVPRARVIWRTHPIRFSRRRESRHPRKNRSRTRTRTRPTRSPDGTRGWICGSERRRRDHHRWDRDRNLLERDRRDNRRACGAGRFRRIRARSLVLVVNPLVRASQEGSTEIAIAPDSPLEIVGRNRREAVAPTPVLLSCSNRFRSESRLRVLSECNTGN